MENHKEPEIFATTLENTISCITSCYIRNLDLQNPPSPEKITGDILDAIGEDISEGGEETKNRWEIPQKLNFTQIAAIMAHLYDIRLTDNSCIRNDTTPNENKKLFIAIDKKDGFREYVSDIEIFRIIAMQYDYTMTDEEFASCMSVLRSRIYCKENDITFEKNIIYKK